MTNAPNLGGINDKCPKFRRSLAAHQSNSSMHWRRETKHIDDLTSDRHYRHISYVLTPANTAAYKPSHSSLPTKQNALGAVITNNQQQHLPRGSEQTLLEHSETSEPMLFSRPSNNPPKSRTLQGVGRGNRPLCYCDVRKDCSINTINHTHTGTFRSTPLREFPPQN